MKPYDRSKASQPGPAGSVPDVAMKEVPSHPAEDDVDADGEKDDLIDLDESVALVAT